MQFDAKAEKRRLKEAEKTKKKQLANAKIPDIYPISGITTEGYLKFTFGTRTFYGEIFDIKKYDLEKLPIDRADTIEESATRLYGEYQGPIKEIFRNFPERNQAQQDYFKRLMTRTNDLKRLNWIEDQLNILIHLEKTYTKLGSWQIIYGESLTELKTNIERLEKYKDVFGFYPITVTEKKLLFNLINNPGGLINGEEENE